MNPHPDSDLTITWILMAPDMSLLINDNIEGSAWRRTHIPDPLSWMRSSSITLLGDVVVAAFFDFMRITAAGVFSHIKNTWRTDMEGKPTLSDHAEPLR